ncbi:colicin E3/pyocin S6 family cytotoxin [Streptomyces platensis]|uniref:colicin E3/pyocin S6 family cytotoxin n=1 Tax=Streptomyces platensis TaxID=58346 RepID=UPI00340824F9
MSAGFEITPDDLQRVSSRFAYGQELLDSVAKRLNASLQNAGGMAGDDKYAKQFAKNYDRSARALFTALSAAVRAVGQASTCLVVTANNYLKADHHSNAKAGGGGHDQYSLPPVFTDVIYPDPDSAVGSGDHPFAHTPLDDYWPSGHQDKLRAAANAYRLASQGLDRIGQDLHQYVKALTDANSSESVHSMATFWANIWQDGAAAERAPLSMAKTACDKLAHACDELASSIDNARSEFEWKMAEAGIAITATTVVAVILTPFTGGGSDVAGAALDSAEAAAIFASVESILDVAVSAIAGDVVGELASLLEIAAEAVPELEAAEAETTEVTQVLEREMAEASSGSRGKGGGGSPPPATRVMPPNGRNGSLPAFPDARPARAKTSVQGGGGKRPRWVGKKGQIYEWDFQHGKVEMYDKSGKKHLGEFDATTGEQTKPGDPTRHVEK